MKQSLIDSLVGLSFDDATEKIKESGFDLMVVDVGAVITEIARPNIIIVGVENQMVKEARAGDPTQLETEPEQ